MAQIKLAFFNDGQVIAYINGYRYVYETDPVYHNQWASVAQYRPGSVLNAIKQQVDKGIAKLVSKPKPPQEAPKVQQRLAFKDWLESI